MGITLWLGCSEVGLPGLQAVQIERLHHPSRNGLQIHGADPAEGALQVIGAITTTGRGLPSPKLRLRGQR